MHGPSPAVSLAHGCIIESGFRPHPLLRNPHLQTLLPTLTRPTPPLEIRRERLELADGDFVDLGWSGNTAGRGPLAILLHEEGLLSRSLIYATDINGHALAQAEAGVYDIDRIAGFTDNHRRSGGRSSLSDYYTAAYGRAVFDKSLKKHMVFSDHSLATDSVFAEVQLVSCRNVLIYFNRELQDRAIRLFRDALCRKGFLGIGAKESLRFSACADAFDELVREDRIYQRKDQP